MIGVSVMPSDPRFEPRAHVQTSRRLVGRGEPFGVIELDDMPGWATVNLGGLDVQGQVRYLLALARAAEAVAHELTSEAMHRARERHA